MIRIKDFCSTLNFNDFSIVKNFELISEKYDGAVLKCKIDNVSMPLTFQMNYNYGLSTKSYMKLCIEADILKKLPYHPNIIFHIHHFYAQPTKMISYFRKDKDIQKRAQYVDKTSFCSVYKYYPSSLQKWMIEKRKDCKLVDIIRICYEISCGVLHLWNYGFIHRNLKLNNILIDDDGHIVITDFGLAVKVNMDGKALVDSAGGNQFHLAPEVLGYNDPREIDYSKQPSFALGVLFHEIIMGYHPFENYPLDYEKYGRGTTLHVPAWNSCKMKMISTLDDRLIELIGNLLHSSPQRRTSLQDCNDILSSLLRLNYSDELVIYNEEIPNFQPTTERILPSSKSNVLTIVSCKVLTISIF